MTDLPRDPAGLLAQLASDAPPSRDSLLAAVARLDDFLGAAPLTERLAGIEHDLLDADADRALAVARAAGADVDLMAAAQLARRRLGRVSDVIHATAIMQVVPSILEPGERITVRPSLAAGNDAKRPFDLETDRRVAEFKLSNWTGADGMRQRGLVKDLVHLAAAPDDRKPELYVVGPRSGHYLGTSKRSIRKALEKNPSSVQLLDARFPEWAHGTVADFSAGPGARVAIIDLAEVSGIGRFALDAIE